MSYTYKATGIILKGKPLGESDRLLTILSPEYGIIQAIAPDARKQNSKLRGRSEIFVVNDLILTKGRSLDKIAQADTITTYSGLSKHFSKLVMGQYLAELTLNLALSEQPQAEIFEILTEHLRRIENLSLANSQTTRSPDLIPSVTQGVFHLLAIAGICPQIHQCCISQTPLKPDFEDPAWEVGFSFEGGGVINLSPKVLESNLKPIKINYKLGVIELTLLQQLAQKNLDDINDLFPKNFNLESLEMSWIKIEKILRKYIEHSFNYKFRSAPLIDQLYQ
jgi:DNA repair protein RecO (recombination protein O)